MSRLQIMALMVLGGQHIPLFPYVSTWPEAYGLLDNQLLFPGNSQPLD